MLLFVLYLLVLIIVGSTANSSPGSPPGILVANHFAQPFGYKLRRPSERSDWLLFYTLAVKGCFRNVASETYTTGAGEVVILAPSTLQDYATANSEEMWDFFWVHFVPRPQWTKWLHLAEIWPGLHSLTISDLTLSARLEGAFQRLV